MTPVALRKHDWKEGSVFPPPQGFCWSTLRLRTGKKELHNMTRLHKTPSWEGGKLDLHNHHPMFASRSEKVNFMDALNPNFVAILGCMFRWGCFCWTCQYPQYTMDYTGVWRYKSSLYACFTAMTATDPFQRRKNARVAHNELCVCWI